MDTGKSYMVCDPVKNCILTLTKIRDGFLSSIGPNSSAKIFQTTDETDVKCGSSSSMLIKSLCLNQQPPIVRLIFAGIEEHVKIYHDFGLYCSVLCLSLLLNTHQHQANIPRSSSSKCYQVILDKVFSILESSSFLSRSTTIKFHELKNVVSSIVCSKCCLRKKHGIKTLISTILQTYIKSDCTELPLFHYQANSTFEKCVSLEGILLDLHHYHNNFLLDLFKAWNPPVDGLVKVLLFDVPITLDYFVGVKLTKNCSSRNSKDLFEIFVTHALVSQLSFCGVKVLLNIKPVCDKVKHLLANEAGVICLDRIGSASLDKLTRVTGCKINYALIDDDPTPMIGSVKVFELITVDKRCYVRLDNKKPEITSAVICYGEAHLTDDVKQVCEASLEALHQTVTSGRVLVGGGKFESLLATELESVFDINYFKPPCPVHHMLGCVSNFTRSLRIIASQLEACQHNDDFVPTDCYQSKLNALKLAVKIACVVLEIKFEIIEN